MKNQKCILAVVLLCLMSEVAWAEEKDKAKLSEQTVVVEAYLLQIRTETLYSQGTAAVPKEKKERVTLLKLLWCLTDPNNGQVITAARTSARSGSEASTQTRRKQVINRELYANNTSFETVNHLWPDGRISVEYALQLESVDPMASASEGLPVSMISHGTQSEIILKPQVPTIVESSQIGDTALFLVMYCEVLK